MYALTQKQQSKAKRMMGDPFKYALWLYGVRTYNMWFNDVYLPAINPIWDEEKAKIKTQLREIDRMIEAEKLATQG